MMGGALVMSAIHVTCLLLAAGSGGGKGRVS